MRVGNYCIAGVEFELVSPPEPFLRELASAWSSFQTDASPSWKLVVELTGPDGGKIQGPREMPLAVRTADGFVLHEPDYRAELSHSERTLTVFQRANRFPTDTAAKLLVAELLTGRGGILLHGVGLKIGPKGAVFAGHSGAGKSTLGRVALAGGLERLSDELVAVVPEGEGYEAWSTPWNVGLQGRVELALLGRLGWAQAPELLGCAPADLLRLLHPNSLRVDDRPEGRARQFRILSGLVSHVRLGQLNFAPDERVVETLRAALS